MKGDVGDQEKKRKSCLRAAFAHLVGRVPVQEVQQTVCLSDPTRELKLALRLRCWARVCAQPCTSDLRVRSGLVVSFSCFTRPARFSGRILRSVGDLSPREKWGVPCTALRNKSARLRCVCPSVAQTSVCDVGPPSLCSLTTQLPLPNLSLGGVDIRLKGLAETLLV